MKKRNIITFIALINIIIIVIIYKLVINNNNIIVGKQVIKEMSESTQVTDLNNQINALNDNHTEYMKHIQNCKLQIATALTNQKVPTSEDATLETMAENIEKILEARTSDATATADNITEGKTAYINGELITGTGVDNRTYYELGANNAISPSVYYYSATAWAYDGEIQIPEGVKTVYISISCASTYNRGMGIYDNENILAKTIIMDDYYTLTNSFTTGGLFYKLDLSGKEFILKYNVNLETGKGKFFVSAVLL